MQNDETQAESARAFESLAPGLVRQEPVNTVRGICIVGAITGLVGGILEGMPGLGVDFGFAAQRDFTSQASSSTGLSL
jgi:hypothetical protein